jgi:hypothetical protein
MLEKDLLLSGSHDLAIESFDLKLTNDEQVVAQRVKRALLLFKGEYFLDSELGMPYYTDILGTKNSIDSIRGIFINEIKSVEGVKEINAFDIVFNDAARALTIQLKLTDTLNNQIDITL